METQPPFDFNLGLKKLNELIKGIRIAMLTTVSKDLTLHSSPLLAQEIEFYGDLYGKKIKLRLKDFIREEIKFDDLDSLKAKINEDVEKAKLYFKTNE
jgi:riboflavin kinase/FMN adenylyltransferase